MIEVLIRKENEPTTHARTLCEISYDEIEDLIESIAEWGIFFDGGDGTEVRISGKYVYYNAEAYFELIISETTPSQNESETDDG